MNKLELDKDLSLNSENYSSSNFFEWKYNNELLKELAKDYKIKLDDPNGDEKYYNYFDRETNPNVVEIDKSIGRIEALYMFMKRRKYLKDLLRNEWIDYLYNIRKENLSEKWYKFCKDMYEKYNIIPIVDTKILDYFSRVMWTVYNWGSLWKFSIVRDWSSIENWPWRIKHEWIHNKQWWIIKWIPSWIDILKWRMELSGLVPRKMDYATDNQISDRETYINQYKDDPIQDVKPYRFLKYMSKNNRLDAIKNHMKSDIDDMKKDINDLRQKIYDIENDELNIKKEDGNWFTKEEQLKNLNYILHMKEKDLNTMEKLQSEHYNTENWHQFITFGEQDGYLYQETPEKRQTNFQSEESFRKHVVIDMFITHYWDKKDNYKEWVEMYSIHKDKLNNVIEKYLKNKDKSELKREMKKIFKEINK